MRKTRNCCEITAINGEKVVVKSTLIKIKQKLGDKFFAIPFSAAIGEEELLFLFVAHHCIVPNECYILIGKKGFFVEIIGQILFSGNKNPTSYTDEPFQFIFSSTVARVESDNKNVIITLKELQPSNKEIEKLLEKLSKSIYNYELSPCLLSCLEKLNIYSLKDLVQKTEFDFKKIKCRENTIKELKEFLATLGLRLGLRINTD